MSWVGGGSGPNFQLLILSLYLLNPKCLSQWGGQSGSIFQPFDPESKSACKWGEWRRGVPDYVRHLVRIWGELQHSDNKIFHQARVSKSQIVSMWRLKIHGRFSVKKDFTPLIDSWKHFVSKIHRFLTRQKCLSLQDSLPLTIRGNTY